MDGDGRRNPIYGLVDMADLILGSEFRWLVIWLWCGERSMVGRIACAHRALRHGVIHGCQLCHCTHVPREARVVYPIWCSRSIRELAFNNSICFVHIRAALYEVVPQWHQAQVSTSDAITITAFYFVHQRHCACDICSNGFHMDQIRY